MKAALIDYGSGNINSVLRALNYVDVSVDIVSVAKPLDAYSLIVIPGVSSFGYSSEALRKLGMFDVILEYFTSEKPILGLCAGFQLFMSSSEESPGKKGFGFLSGTVKRLPECQSPIPNQGWYLLRSKENDPLQDLTDVCYGYFSHSFSVSLSDDADISRSSSILYGGFEVCASVSTKNLVGFQFHPEKSGLQGLEMLRGAVDYLMI